MGHEVGKAGMTHLTHSTLATSWCNLLRASDLGLLGGRVRVGRLEGWAPGSGDAGQFQPSGQETLPTRQGGLTFFKEGRPGAGAATWAGRLPTKPWLRATPRSTWRPPSQT